MRELIKTCLYEIIQKLVPDFRGDILVEIPGNKEHGDYTTNIAFALTKILGKSPQEIAKNLVDELEKQKISDFSKIESKNGFINFFLSPECLHHQIRGILKQKNKFGFSGKNEGKHIQVEFISANPTGPLTVGNGRGGSYGDTLANVLETQGHKVVREFFINDRGGQILALGRSIKLAQGEKLDLEQAESENLYQGGYINDLARQINNGLSVEEAGQEAAGLILETYIKPAVKRLGIKFDNWFSEKSLYSDKQHVTCHMSLYNRVMEDLMRKNLVYEKDGATWMKTSGLGDDKDRVLIKSSGDETYFMSDILYHFDKFNVRKFDKVINIWGADHHGDMPRLLGALKIMGIDLGRLDVILYQFVRLIKNGKEVKVSKRAGTFVTLEELINEVGLDAARFFFLMYSPNTHMDFDMELAKQRSEKNPVYYVQYAHARLSSIIKKARKANLKSQISNLKFLKENDDNLIRKLIEFPELLTEVSKNYEIHCLPRYALELAREFHNFYEKERVITEDKNLTSARLALVMATKIVLANILSLMGIKAPDRM